MNGFMKVYTNINNLYSFVSGEEGYGYSSLNNISDTDKEYWHMEILVPIDRIIVSDGDRFASRFMIKWRALEQS